MLPAQLAPVSRPAASTTADGDERSALARRLKAQAYGLGFDLVGITMLGPAETAPAFDAWIAAGRAGDMHYLPRGAEKRRDSRLPYDGARTAIVVGMNYGGAEPPGPVARYARGDDYHDVMTAKLSELQGWLSAELGSPVAGKAYVDTGPILERDLARRAGLGWFGKNTNLINPAFGSFFFLGALLIDLHLPSDAPFEADRCGSCTRCIDACPTDALLDPRVLDATRCISYLTIELKGAIPEALRHPLGELVYGCDICQDVCPWNEKFATALPDGSPFAPRDALGTDDAPTLAGRLLAMSQDEFNAAFRHSPMKRAKLRGLKRNAAVILGNMADPAGVPALSAALSDEEPLVRGHAGWALGVIGSPDARAALQARVALESDASVLAELRSAVLRSAPRPTD